MDALRDLAARLVIPGLPDWTGIAALLVLLLVGLAFALMPFAVFGVKGRLEAIETELVDLRLELRSLSLRLGDAPRRVVAEDWAEAPAPRRGDAAAPRVTPPVPPPAAWPDRRMRAEPRVDLPR